MNKVKNVFFLYLFSYLIFFFILKQNYPIKEICHTTTITIISVSSFSTSANEAVSATITITSAAATIILISTSSLSISANELCFNHHHEICLNHSFYLFSYQSFFLSRCRFMKKMEFSPPSIQDLMWGMRDWLEAETWWSRNHR